MSWNIQAADLATQIPFPYTAPCYFFTIPRSGSSLTLFRIKAKLYKAVFYSTPETQSLIPSFPLFPQQPGLECSQTAANREARGTRQGIPETGFATAAGTSWNCVFILHMN